MGRPLLLLAQRRDRYLSVSSTYTGSNRTRAGRPSLQGRTRSSSSLHSSLGFFIQRYMADSTDSIYIDLTRAVHEFSFGPSDYSDDSEPESSEFDDWDSIGLLPSWQRLQITVRNASYSFIAGLKKDRNGDAAEPSAPTAVDNPGNETVDGKPHSDFDKSDTTTANEPTSNRDSENSQYQSGEASLDRAEDEYDEDELSQDDSDVMEEIGRLPNFAHLHLTLRNASEILSPTIFGNVEAPSFPKFLSPADLLAKWGGPINSGTAGWQAFMQNLQLPAFLAEEPTDDEEPLDLEDPAIAALCSTSGLTADDFQIGYNEEGLTGCAHYLRSCKTECATCHKFYMCQLCHDEVNLHQMDRRATPRMLCLSCQHTQPPRRTCAFCKEVMGDYYCSECKLWNDDPDKPIYHCDKCGICRVGQGLGIDVFHCDTCAICLNLTMQDNHRCIEQAARSNCPICLEDLFLSQKPTVFMPCGHPIHRECFNEYSKRYYRCPICSKSILNTSALFRMIDEEVRCEVLPPELANKLVKIVCRDCRLKSQTKYHLAGLKCETCGSYNTARI